eukprot:4865681-Amphidinium_carterae.1
MGLLMAISTVGAPSSATTTGQPSQQLAPTSLHPVDTPRAKPISRCKNRVNVMLSKKWKDMHQKSDMKPSFKLLVADKTARAHNKYLIKTDALVPSHVASSHRQTRLRGQSLL